MECTVKKVTVFRDATFLTNCFVKYIFLEIYELFNIMTVKTWTAKCDFNKDYCNKFDYSNFDVDNYCFLLHVKLL